MHPTDGAADQALRQFRLARFGLVLALMCIGFVAVTFLLSLWLRQLAFNRSSVLLLVAGAAFAALWLLLRGAPTIPSICAHRRTGQRCSSARRRSRRWRWSWTCWRIPTCSCARC